jgi:hypothetical protein
VIPSIFPSLNLVYHCGDTSDHSFNMRYIPCFIFSSKRLSFFVIPLLINLSSFTRLQLIAMLFCFQPTSTVTNTPFTLASNLVSMSQAIPPTSGLDVGFGGLNCPSCSIFTPYVPVNSNKNGNKGIPFAVVCPSSC